MSASDRMAIDVALLLPEPVQERSRAVNAALWAGRPDGFRFDATHLPHITLAQQFVRRASLPALTERIDPVLHRVQPLALRLVGVGSSETALHFGVEPTPDLQRLHENLMDALQPLEEADGSAEAFYSEGEPAREKDIEWVRQYRIKASYANFVPHITLGIGRAPELLEPFEFTADQVALCHLGRFCTCRVVLREWRLEPAKRNGSLSW